MKIKDRLEILKLIYSSTYIDSILKDIRAIDTKKELNVWKKILDKNDIYDLVTKAENMEQINNITDMISNREFRYNDYFYKEDEESNIFTADLYELKIINNIEIELWNYFEALEEKDE